MSEKVQLDPDQRASLRFPKFTAQFDTLREALAHWNRLQPGERGHAVLVLETNQVYQPPQIENLELKAPRAGG